MHTYTLYIIYIYIYVTEYMYNIMDVELDHSREFIEMQDISICVSEMYRWETSVISCQ